MSDFRDFINICKRKGNLNFVIIIDALDEILDKAKRGLIFNYLEDLMQKNSSCRWILSCRQEEYRAYAQTLTVSNIQIKQLSLSQVNKLLTKRLESYNRTKIKDQNIGRIRKTILALADSDVAQEGFLRNPYYLSLWLYEIYVNENIANKKRLIPSIGQLHQIEIKRELAKNQKEYHESQYDLIDDSLLNLYLEILSTLSFYLLKSSLKSKNLSEHGLSIWNPMIIRSITRRSKTIQKLIRYDSITLDRIRQLEEYGLPSDQNNIKLTEENRLFYDLFKQAINEGLISKDNFTVFTGFCSVIEQSYRYGLIKLDIESGQFFRFLNQRSGDYLAAFYLVKNNLLEDILLKPVVNFWLFRTISICIAISNNLGSLLQPEVLSNDGSSVSRVITFPYLQSKLIIAHESY